MASQELLVYLWLGSLDALAACPSPHVLLHNPSPLLRETILWAVVPCLQCGFDAEGLCHVSFYVFQFECGVLGFMSDLESSYSEVLAFAGESLCIEIAGTDAQLFFQLTTA